MIIQYVNKLPVNKYLGRFFNKSKKQNKSKESSCEKNKTIVSLLFVILFVILLKKIYNIFVNYKENNTYKQLDCHNHLESNNSSNTSSVKSAKEEIYSHNSDDSKKTHGESNYETCNDKTNSKLIDNNQWIDTQNIDETEYYSCYYENDYETENTFINDNLSDENEIRLYVYETEDQSFKWGNDNNSDVYDKVTEEIDCKTQRNEANNFSLTEFINDWENTQDVSLCMLCDSENSKTTNLDIEETLSTCCSDCSIDLIVKLKKINNNQDEIFSFSYDINYIETSNVLKKYYDEEEVPLDSI